MHWELSKNGEGNINFLWYMGKIKLNGINMANHGSSPNWKTTTGI